MGCLFASASFSHSSVGCFLVLVFCIERLLCTTIVNCLTLTLPGPAAGVGESLTVTVA